MPPEFRDPREDAEDAEVLMALVKITALGALVGLAIGAGVGWCLGGVDIVSLAAGALGGAAIAICAAVAAALWWPL